MKKVKRYTIYALGEIFLVVIGILIALQINNWNENNKNEQLAIKYLKNVQSDLKQDTTVFSNTLVSINQINDFKKWGLNQTDFDGVGINYLLGLVSSKYFNIQSNDQAFQRMNDPNIMNIEEFDSVYIAINNYYTFQQDYLQNFNDWDKESSLKESDYWNLQDIYEIDFTAPEDSITVLQNEDARFKALEKKILSVEGRNYIKMSKLRIATIHSIYERQLSSAKRVLARIDKALASRS
jgi:hypothetical protein